MQDRTSFKSWTTRSGKRRVIRLYGAWRNLLARTRGSAKAGNGRNYWAGKRVEWKNFKEFRAWAIKRGYSRERCSLDRRNAKCGYTDGNCRWLTVAQNTIHENNCRKRAANRG